MKQKEFRFEEVPGDHGSVVKYLYLGDELYGIGQDLSARIAKLKCAIHALGNLKQNKVAKRKLPKDGFLSFIKQISAKP